MLQAWLARLPSRVASTAGPSAWFLGKPARLPVGHVLALCFRALSRHPSVMRPGVCVRMCACAHVCVEENSVLDTSLNEVFFVLH